AGSSAGLKSKFTPTPGAKSRDMNMEKPQNQWSSVSPSQLVLSSPPAANRLLQSCGV
ncbi:hypothetical protein FQA47_000762, partial [Oryzias melastigma]